MLPADRQVTQDTRLFTFWLPRTCYLPRRVRQMNRYADACADTLITWRMRGASKARRLVLLQHTVCIS